jgi:hypothetical protein
MIDHNFVGEPELDFDGLEFSDIAFIWQPNITPDKMMALCRKVVVDEIGDLSPADQGTLCAYVLTRLREWTEKEMKLPGDESQ